MHNDNFSLFSLAFVCKDAWVMVISNWLICQRVFLMLDFQRVNNANFYTTMRQDTSAFTMKFEQQQLEIAGDLDINKVLEPVSPYNAIIFINPKILCAINSIMWDISVLWARTCLLLLVHGCLSCQRRERGIHKMIVIIYLSLHYKIDHIWSHETYTVRNRLPLQNSK